MDNPEKLATQGTHEYLLYAAFSYIVVTDSVMKEVLSSCWNKCLVNFQSNTPHGELGIHIYLIYETILVD